MKKYSGVILFVGLQMVHYFRSGHEDLEMFFLIWAFISLAAPGFIILGGSKTFPMGFGSVRGADSNFAALSVFFSERMIQKGGRENTIKVLDILPVLLLIVIAFLNSIGLIIVTVRAL